MQETEYHFDEIIFTPIVDIVECTEATKSLSEGSMWTDAAIKLMLSNFKELYGKVGKSSSIKNKTKLWQTIAENLSKEGCRFSPSQVENKFRGLKRQYKKFNNSQTGRGRMTCIYQSQLDEILGVKKGINSEYTLDNESKRHSFSHSPAESSQEALDDSPKTSSRARETEKGNLLKKLEEMSKEKEKRHQKLLELLERKEFNKLEKEKEKKEREKRRKELENRVVDLSEKLVNKLEKEKRHQKLLELLERKEFNKTEKEKEKKEREKRREKLENRVVDLLEKLVNKSEQ